MKKLLYLLLMCCAIGTQAQQAPSAGKLGNMAAALDSFRNRVPVEKVHIQLDKPYYTLGDTIWMKAYVVNENNELSPLSKLLYVELVTDADSVKIGLRLPLTAGLGWGAITLSDSLLTEGNYHIRAYTTLMRNFPGEYFFDKSVKIGNVLDASAKALLAKLRSGASLGNVLAAADTAISVQFFPEGGDMVSGLSSVVAFKALGTDGLGREVSGVVVDKAGKIVVPDLHSVHAGMGTFMLTPVLDNAYTAVIKFDGGLEKRFPLPVAKGTGYGLSVTQNEVNMVVRIDASEALLNKGEVSLVVQANNTILYTGKKVLTASGFVTVIPKKRFPEGIVQFTLFSPDYVPVAERLAFIQKGEQLNVHIVPDKPGYNKRDKVHLNLEVTDAEGKPAVGVFSMAVTDDGKVPYNEVDEKTIFSNLLLTSNLKGFVEHPNYYFMDTAAVRATQLDNLLLTQGWRRFIWQDVLADKLPVLSYQPDNGPGISGRVANSKGKGSPFAKVHLLVGGMLVDTVANAVGAFRFDGVSLGKEVKFNVVATDTKGKKNVTVELDKEKAPSFPAVLPLPQELPLKEDIAVYAQNNGQRLEAVYKEDTLKAIANGTMIKGAGGKMLKAVEIKEKKTIAEIATQFRDQRYPRPDRIFTFLDLDKVHNVSSYLSTRTGSMHIAPSPNGDFSKISYFGGDILVLVNGHRPIPGELAAISPQQIAAVEIFMGPMVPDMSGYGVSKTWAGAVVVTLKDPTFKYQPYIDAHDDEVKKEKDKTIALKEVQIKAQKEDEVKKLALKDSRSLAGPADQVLTFVDLADCNSLGLCLATKLSGVRVTPQPNGSFTAAFEGQDMSVVVDGRLLDFPQELSYLSTISSDQIAAIEVIKGGRAAVYKLKSKYSSGVIIITLKTGGVNYEKYIEEHDTEKLRSLTLKAVTITSKKEIANIKTVATQHSANLAGPGNADQVLTFMDLLTCGGKLSDCLAGRLVNVVFKNGVPYARGFDSPMYIVVDGMGGRDLASLDPNDVSSIEVLRGGGAASLYGMQAANGVLIITTKQGDVDYASFIPGYHPYNERKPVLVNYKFRNGYDLRRQFYSPDYDNPNTNKQLADLRTTIYWNPNIVTDENGKASVDFFNAAGAGNYKVITEGLNLGGQLGRQVIKYGVK